MKGFKCKIPVKVLLSKHKINGGILYAPAYFKSATKTVINSDKYLFSRDFIQNRQLD